MNDFLKSEKIVAAFVVGGALVIASIVISVAWYVTTLPNGFNDGYNDVIMVPGVARQQVTSDAMKWTFSFSREYFGTNPKTAYDQMEKDEKRVVDFLHQHNITDEEIVISPISYLQTGDYAYNQSITAPTLRQSVEVRSGKVQEITKLSSEISPFFESGLKIYSQPLEYYVVNLPALQGQVAAQAIANAKETASKLALPDGRQLRGISGVTVRTVSVGPVNNTQDYTTSDTTTLQKDIRVIVDVTYRLE